MNTLPETVWQELLVFLPALQNREPLYWRVGAWGDMPSVVSHETARHLYTYLDKHILLPESVDWMAWQTDALTYQDQRELLQTADLYTVQQILTAHLCADRLVEGHYDALLENGFLRDVLTQVAALLSSSRFPS